MRLMEGEHVGPFNLGNPGEFTMIELAQVRKFSLYSSNYCTISMPFCSLCEQLLRKEEGEY